MVNYLLIALIILLYSLQTLFCTGFNNGYAGDKALASPVFNIIEGFFIALVTLCFIGFRFAPSPVTVIIGCLNAIALFGYNTSMLKASESGSYAFMCLSYLVGGFVVPLIVDSFVSTPITLPQWCCIGGMLAAFVLINIEMVNLHGASLKYYVYCAVLFVCNGAYGSLVKVQTVFMESESQQMVVITYGMTGLIALVSLIAKEKGGTLRAFAGCKGKAVPPLAGCLLVSAFAVNALVYVMPLVDLAVLNPSLDGGVLLVSAAFARLVYKERFTVLKTVGLLIATAMIVVLNLLGTAA